MNTEPLNFHFTPHFSAREMPVVFSGQALAPVQNEKTTACPFNAFFLPLLMDDLGDRRSAGAYCKRRGEKNPQSSPNIPIRHPMTIQGQAGTLCTVSSCVPLCLPPPHLFLGPSASVRWDFREQCPRGTSRGRERRQSMASQADTSSMKCPSAGSKNNNNNKN